MLLLGAVAGALLSGRISDRLGRRIMLGPLGAIFTVGIVAAAVATGFVTMLVGRIVMGVGVGGVSATVRPTSPRSRPLTSAAGCSRSTSS